jgi:biotin carboxyl carrier protein
VTKNQAIIVMEAMKMKTPMPAPQDGTVKEIKVEAGQRVSTGDVLLVIE